MACTGDNTQACGGPNRMNLYLNGGSAASTTPATPPPTTAPPAPAGGPYHNPGPAGWGGIGCYTDAGARTLTYTAATAGGQGALTVALCTTACSAANYIYAGVEYSGECFCGNAFSNGGGPAPDGLTGCNMLCNGNKTEYCGGPNRLDTYKLGAAPTTPVAPPPATTPAPPPSSTSAVVTTRGLPTGWAYKACYVDNANGRILAYQVNPDNAALTIEICVNKCIGLGYSVAGMEYSTQCFCGNAIIQGGVPANADTECNMACGGDATEKCGAGNRMSIYATGTLTTQQAAAVQKTGLPGSWTYQSCITDNINNVRTFPNKIVNPNGNSAQYCLSLCATYGFMAAGMEYGEECYCGDVANIAAAGTTVRPDGECNTVCPGDSRYLCGAGNRLSYYKWTGTPINVWNYPTGNGAGAYQFLIGGVVIPLITTTGINGKYTFVEKYGTGAPNSTGAYELDVSQINNPAQAWRPMHVKSDVFCSAGLTLPDRAGRQINIGGWSGQSTYGIRLYWPDGSPGVWGKNDWQENYNELALQTGRWYPSAMIMANGSILVVGGENGSNGPPVPNLELLPKAGGLVQCDFLAQTDPYSLYPFLAVLPSGGIFIAYYNQARILDEVTLGTKQTLPRIPSGVSDPLGGRTYPLEGTAVLMPQRAPYNDPLTIMICGGSTPGPAIAIDNCVSIRPDVANDPWVIERMPSQRVMTCMTALPDGTYLILNGAKQGVAGFGLATLPNTGAVLYDPSKPINQRFSVMANTIVARLYHSEAILMQDGRVLVSGSDPQDGKNPQEYRVEVFLPPYALSGLAKPSYTLTNKDWAYGAQIQITVNVPSGNVGGVRVSLMGAESSTHGNSMGQRTLFPALACAGNTCTITAPPNAHICPPGWFQVFVLDGPTPSSSQWVRIGGDPGSLGNWPNFPDFSRPGLGGI